MHFLLRIKLGILSVTIIVLLSGDTFMRNSIWCDEVSLWQDAVLKSPNKAGTYYSLGLAYAKAGQIENAVKYMRISIQLDGGTQFNAWSDYDEMGRISQFDPLKRDRPFHSQRESPD